MGQESSVYMLSALRGVGSAVGAIQAIQGSSAGWGCSWPVGEQPSCLQMEVS